ncbi:hypothetical protein N656DRAFT_778028 [Canariomyces notabilis]|uniref:Uncharacterized protein n=1 Tax=Canariomyces notabilis TaxID=2074819 RepID=A0AAN6TGG1_9PEZI|nr:hypothetical protein N656DRAFT_778028 [Canariomyces arenarius]
MTRHTYATTTTTTVPRRRGLFSRRAAAPRRAPAPRRRGFFSGRRGAVPVTVPHHQKRRTSIGDKISGALLRLKGTLTGRPGQKAAGTRRMHGTDGRGARRRHFI